MGARVLIADDHEMVRRGIRSLLETHYDIEVTEACDGREAVEKTVVQKPDLVILDVSMPLLDGLSAARQIRKVAPETAILFLTFQKSDMLRDEARRIGVIGCLTKGEDGGALLKAIDDAIGGQTALQIISRTADGSSNEAPSQFDQLPMQESFPFSGPRSARSPLLRVLLCHGREEYIERCRRELESLQFQIESEAVQTADECSQRLKLRHYDIVLAECPVDIAQQNRTADLLCRSRRNVPLIFVTDKLERETVATLLNKGAADCVDLDNLGGLPIAVLRALKENALRKERNRAEKKLQHSEAHYRALMENLAFGICRCRLDGAFVEVNQALVAILGYGSKEELLASHLPIDFIHDPSQRAQLLGEQGSDGRINPLETDWKKKDGTTLKVRLSGREVNTQHGKRDGYELIVEDVTQQRELEDDLRRQAARDPLTGLANYRYLVSVLENEINRSQRTERQFALLLFDLDGLKQINDQYGHLTGSEALCRLAEALTRGCRNIDTAARFGGDEFAVVLPETDIESAKSVAQRLCDNLKNDGKTPPLSVSVGVAIFPTDGQEIETLFLAADIALYGMKARVHKPPRMIQ
jgi:diguanylate cyclase (GGDEF)-like protein/PAS domain S-box-containing protein